MLTAGDRDWIKANRAEISEGRSEDIIIIHETVTGEDVYSGFPITEETQETVSVVWREFSTFGNLDFSVVAGIEIQKDDVRVAFEPEVNLTDVTKITRSGVDYAILSVDAKGVGGLNRYECIVRTIT